MSPYSFPAPRCPPQPRPEASRGQIEPYTPPTAGPCMPPGTRPRAPGLAAETPRSDAGCSICPQPARHPSLARPTRCQLWAAFPEREICCKPAHAHKRLPLACIVSASFAGEHHGHFLSDVMALSCACGCPLSPMAALPPPLPPRPAPCGGVRASFATLLLLNGTHRDHMKGHPDTTTTMTRAPTANLI